MTSTVGRFCIIGLALLSLVSLWRAIGAERERLQIAKAHEEAKALIQQLQVEQDHLNTQLATAKQTIDTQAGDLTTYRHDLEVAKERLQRAATELASIQEDQNT